MTSEISRRHALQVATLGATAVVIGGTGTWRSLIGPGLGSLEARQDQPLIEPPILASQTGVLEVDLRAASGVTLAGRKTRALGYNGISPGPTLRVRPGDTLRVNLANDLADATNLHTHGLHVSPQGRSDNIFRAVEAGQTAQYEYAVPENHPTGTFWYHPHHHGMVADQIFGGLFGTLLVVGSNEPEVARERVLVISDTTLTGNGEIAPVSAQQVMAGREGDLVLVNGQLHPRIAASQGSVERWRVVNACTSRFLRLQLDGHTWGFLGYDGQSLGGPDERDTVVLAPGNRADLLVRPHRAGTFTLRTLSYDRGGMGMMRPGPSGTSRNRDLATVQVGDQTAPSAAPTAPLLVWPGPASQSTDLRGQPADARRTITFTMGMGMGGMTAGFDGRQFDPDRIDQRLTLGTIEEWTIANASPMDHPFHLHVWPMQVVEAEGVNPSERPDWRDVVIVPARGQVRIRVRVADFPGRTVYHCHVLDHEDNGMMGTVLATT